MTTPAYDPDFDRVPLLLHFDGNWQDSSSAGRVLTAANGAVATPTGGLFGTGCADFTGTNNAWARTDTSIDLAVTGDFSLELQFMPTELVPATHFLLAAPSLLGTDGPYIWLNVGDSGRLSAHVLNYTASNVGPLLLNQWNSIHLMRAGSAAAIWLNGEQVWSEAVLISMTEPALWQFGSLPSTFVQPGSGGRCRMEEVRLTIGATRQPGTQTSPFPNQAEPLVWPAGSHAWPGGAAFK